MSQKSLDYHEVITMKVYKWIKIKDEHGREHWKISEVKI